MPDLDAIDKRIISVLQKDGRITLQEIGQKVELSRISVAKRLENLIDKKMIKIEGLVDLRKLGGFVSLVSIEADMVKRKKLAEMLNKCPRVLWLMETTGNYNLVVIMWSENNDVLSSVVEKCIRPCSSKCDVNIGSYPEFPEFCSTTFFSEKAERAPCGIDCKKCEFYSSKCYGCPATKSYKKEGEL